MKNVRVGKYMIYKVYSERLKEEETLFFLPDENFNDMVNRLSTLTAYKVEGFKVMGVMYVDREAYINARLTYRCQKFLEMDEFEQETRRKIQNGEMREEVAIQTLEMIRDQKWTILKQVHINFNRLVHYDYEIENELACQLNDLYLQGLNL